MTTLLESVGQQMTPQVLGTIGKSLGVDEATVQKGLDVIGPVVQGGLAEKSTTTGGMDEIMKMLSQLEGSGGGLGDILGMLTKGGPMGDVASAGALGGVFGPATAAIGKVLSQKLGFDVTPLLAAAVPAILGAIAGAAKNQKLDSAGVANLLQTEQKEYLANASPEMQSTLQEVRGAAEQAVAIEKAFSPEEWTKIRLAPLAVTYYVMSASPSGVIGSMKELSAAGDAMKDVLKDAGATSLVNVAFGNALQIPESEVTINENSPRDSMLKGITSAGAAVKAKMPAEAQSFANTLNMLAQKVAEAAKEGGFLGIGAKVISKEEQQALDEIRAALA